MTGPSFENVRKKLDQAGRKYTPSPTDPNHIQAACPVRGHEHDDRNLSLSVDYKPAERKTDMWCFVCGPEKRMDAVRDALGLKLVDLFDEPYQAHPSDVADLDRSCGDKHSLLPLGKPDKPARGESWFPREWERGRPTAWKVRQTCKRCGDRTFHWRRPDGRGGTRKGKPDGVMPLGGLPDLLDAIDSGHPVHVYATEGETDAEALRKLGMIAVTAGGTNDWKPEHVDQLGGVDQVTFTSDADRPGRGLASRMRGWLTERDITHRVVEPVEGCKDVREHLEAGHSLSDLVPWPEPPDEPPNRAEPSADDAWEAEQNAAFQLARDVVREAHRIKIRELARQKLAQEAAAELALPEMIGLTEFLATPDPPTRYLIDGTWPKGGHVLFAAQWKAGKSTARDNVVRSLADGEPFLGTFKVEPITEGTIVVIDDELDPDMLRRWLRDQRIVNTDRVVVVPMRGRTASFDLTLPEVRAIWVERLRAAAAAVVILDCLRPILDALGLSEDKEAGRFLVQFDAMLQEAEVRDGMIIHHMGHVDERARGDSAILAWGDSLWKLVRDNSDEKIPIEERARYFTAFGRDVNARESRLSYDEHTRRLTISGGTRSESKAEEAWPDVRAYIVQNPDCSGAAIERDVDHNRQPIRDAIKAAEKRGEIHIDRTGGKGKPNLHRLSAQVPLFEDNLATSPEPREANPRGIPHNLATSLIERGGGGGTSEGNVPDLARGEVKSTVFDLFVRAYNERDHPPSGRTVFDLLGGEPMLQRFRNYNPN